VDRRSGAVIPLLIGAAALIAGTLLGWDARLVEAVVTPPALVRAVLTATAVVIGAALLARSVARIGEGRGDPASRPNLPVMIRGVRLAFLAVAAFAAAAGWLLGHPLPIVVALVIAGVDVIETSFLLLVVRAHRG
jgi:lysylphosphatidylglycerol synthetase-like protein (DUF2156 family)